MNPDRIIGGVLQGCAVVGLVFLAIQAAIIWLLIDWFLFG
jgi:hypothetical protein